MAIPKPNNAPKPTFLERLKNILSWINWIIPDAKVGAGMLIGITLTIAVYFIVQFNLALPVVVLGLVCSGFLIIGVIAGQNLVKSGKEFFIDKIRARANRFSNSLTTIITRFTKINSQNYDGKKQDLQVLGDNLDNSFQELKAIGKLLIGIAFKMLTMGSLLAILGMILAFGSFVVGYMQIAEIKEQNILIQEQNTELIKQNELTREQFNAARRVEFIQYLYDADSFRVPIANNRIRSDAAKALIQIDRSLDSTKTKQVDLHGAHLEDVGLSFEDLKNINLGNAYLRGAVLYDAKLDSSDLSLTDLTLADLRKSSLEYADLYGSYLNEADLSHATFNHKTDLTEVDLDGTWVHSANWFEELKEIKVKGINDLMERYIIVELRKKHKSQTKDTLLYQIVIK